MTFCCTMIEQWSEMDPSIPNWVEFGQVCSQSMETKALSNLVLILLLIALTQVNFLLIHGISNNPILSMKLLNSWISLFQCCEACLPNLLSWDLMELKLPMTHHNPSLTLPLSKFSSSHKVLLSINTHGEYTFTILMISSHSTHLLGWRENQALLPKRSLGMFLAPINTIILQKNSQSILVSTPQGHHPTKPYTTFYLHFLCLFLVSKQILDPLLQLDS